MIRLFKHYISYNVVLLSLIDFHAAAAGRRSRVAIARAQIGTGVGQVSDRAVEIGVFAVIWLGMIAVGSYGPEALRSIRFATARLLVAVSLGVLAISLINFVIPGSALWRSVLLYAMGIAMVDARRNRMLASRMLGAEAFPADGAGAGRRRTRRSGSSACRTGRKAASGSRPSSRWGNAAPRRRRAVRRDAISDLGRFADRVGATEVVLALQERRNSLPLKDLLRVKTQGRPRQRLLQLSRT